LPGTKSLEDLEAVLREKKKEKKEVLKMKFNKSFQKQTASFSWL
jgi:hypothetical protein